MEQSSHYGASPGPQTPLLVWAGCDAFSLRKLNENESYLGFYATALEQSLTAPTFGGGGGVHSKENWQLAAFTFLIFLTWPVIIMLSGQFAQFWIN